MAEKAKEAAKNDKIMLVSPKGYKYELSVSDEGNLNVVYVPEKADDAE